MIIAEKKPFEEIKRSSIDRYQKVLVVGCKGCVAVCLAGGEKEANLLTSELSLTAKNSQKDIVVETTTLERQCDMEFLAELEETVDQYDALLSMACGAGIQFMAEKYPSIPVIPAVNTTFIGANRALGQYEEKCRACGDCVLDQTAGVCPVTMCSKGLFNGPCGGTNHEACEVDQNQPCAWREIVLRLTAQGRLDQILEVEPVRDWANQIPRNLTQPGYEPVD